MSGYNKEYEDGKTFARLNSGLYKVGGVNPHHYGTKKYNDWQKGYNTEKTEKFQQDRKADMKESKFEKYLLEMEQEFELQHSSGLTSKQVAEIRKKEGIKFNPDAGHPTQRSNTTATYIKFYNMIPNELKKGMGLDYSAGLGIGSDALRNLGANIESYEPFPHERAKDITHKGLNSLPNKKYDYILNSAVINVIEQDIRDSVIVDIWNHLKPDGVAIIGARSKADVMGTKTALRLSDTEILDRSRGSYQKGFTSGELKSYIQKLIPDATITMVTGLSQVVVKVFKDFDWNQK